MTNEALQELIGSWFPNPDIEGVSEIIEDSENDEVSEEKPEPINPSLLQFTEEESQFLNVLVKPKQLYQLMTQLKSDSATSFNYL